MTVQELQEKVRGYLKEDVLSENPQIWEELQTNIDTVVNTSLSGVIENKERLLKEKKKLAEQLDQIQSKAQPFIENDISFETYEKLKAELDEMKSKGMSAAGIDLKAVQSEFYEQGKKQMRQEMEPKIREMEEARKMTEKMKEETFKRYKDTLKRNAIDNALIQLNIQADPYWKQGFYASAEDEYLEAEDRLSISVPNPIEPDGPKIPLNDWCKLFPQTEAGKKLIKAPVSSGGSSIGSDGKPIIKTSIEDTLNSMFKH